MAKIVSDGFSRWHSHFFDRNGLPDSEELSARKLVRSPIGKPSRLMRIEPQTFVWRLESRGMFCTPRGFRRILQNSLFIGCEWNWISVVDYSTQVSFVCLIYVHKSFHQAQINAVILCMIEESYVLIIFPLSKPNCLSKDLNCNSFE